MVTADDIGLAGGEFFSAADAEGAAGQGEENAHPYTREVGPAAGLLGVGFEVAEQEEGDEDDQHGHDEDQDHPDGPDAAGEGPEEGGLVAGEGLGRRYAGAALG